VSSFIRGLWRLNFGRRRRCGGIGGRGLGRRKFSKSIFHTVRQGRIGDNWSSSSSFSSPPMLMITPFITGTVAVIVIVMLSSPIIRFFFFPLGSMVLIGI